MAGPELVDYYEVLQVSPRAHPMVIVKAYRLLAALYHPDNRATGDVDRFREVAEAAKVLTDPRRRAAYDRERGGGGNGHGKEAAEPPDSQEPARPRHPDDHRAQRQGLLQALYNMRRNRPSQPGLSLLVIIELLGCSVDEAQFTLWYLRGKKFIEASDDGWAITVAGVDFVESSGLEVGADASEPEMLSLTERSNAIEAL
ncbi:MAG TPA: J domain-containing protein [Candidatus Binatia bacterium]|nr:J domain-containing protein [Candidatus Binatia bacterium]